MTATADRTLPFEVRASVYGLLAGLFLSPPDEALLATLRSPDFVAEWPLGRGTPHVEAGLSRLTTALSTVTAEAVRAEFWHLFGTLGPAAAPPWESVYLDREHVVFGSDTLRVRALYARFGLVFPEASRQPDDHIGLELEFLARLSAATVERMVVGDEEGVQVLLAGQRECLEEHLLRWAEAFVTKVEAASATGFYSGVARLTLGVLRSA